MSVTDGDTVRVRDSAGVEFNVRVEGVDCPESGQPFGGVARRFTLTAVFDQIVVVKPMGHDARARLIARIVHGDNDLSVELLKNGLAWHYTQFSKDPVLSAAEHDARINKRGLWSGENPVPPWVWRRQSRQERARRSGSVDDVAGPFYGNTASRVFHAAKCRNAHCKNCSAIFKTSAEAVAAGYRPAGDCLR
jgi:endonuclease YncB( thermonuclease family)